jgi:hypothetical protein
VTRRLTASCLFVFLLAFPGGVVVPARAFESSSRPIVSILLHVETDEAAVTPVKPSVIQHYVMLAPEAPTVPANAAETSIPRWLFQRPPPDARS